MSADIKEGSFFASFEDGEMTLWKVEKINSFQAKLSDFVAVYTPSKTLIANGFLISSTSEGDQSEYWYPLAKLAYAISPEFHFTV